MSGIPSQLGKLILDDICTKSKKLDNCCCQYTVWGLFREKIPVTIRNHIAQLEFNKDTFTQIFDIADQVYASNQVGEPAVAAVKVSSDETQEVAAINKNKGRNSSGKNQNQNQRNQNQNKNQNQSQSKPSRHATAKGADDKLCKIHFKFGVNATFCASPWKCPMKDTLSAPK